MPEPRSYMTVISNDVVMLTHCVLLSAEGKLLYVGPLVDIDLPNGSVLVVNPADMAKMKRQYDLARAGFDAETDTIQ